MKEHPGKRRRLNGVSDPNLIQPQAPSYSVDSSAERGQEHGGCNRSFDDPSQNEAFSITLKDFLTLGVLPPMRRPEWKTKTFLSWKITR